MFLPRIKLLRPTLLFGLPFLFTLTLCAVLTVTGHFSPRLATVLSVVILCLWAVISVLFFVFRKRPCASILFKIGASFISLAIGLFFFVSYHGANIKDYSSLSSQTISLVGKVTDISTGKGSSARYTLLVTATSNGEKSSLSQESLSLLVGKSVYLYPGFYADDLSFSHGDELSVLAKINLPKDSFEDYTKEQGIALLCNATAAPTLVKKSEGGFINAMKSFNLSLRQKLDTLLPSPHSALVKAMLLGDTSGLSDSSLVSYMRSGLSHAFSVSGLHIAILSSMIILLLRLLELPYKARIVITCVGIWGLVFLTGFKLPAIRSGVMLTFGLLSPFFHRDSDSFTSLVFPAILVGIQNPFGLISLSFLLSFSATRGIVLLNRPISNLIKSRFRKIPSLIYEPLSITISANIATLPVSVFAFKGISAVVLISNLLLLPLIPIIMVISVLILLLGEVPAIGLLLITVLKTIITAFIFVANSLAKLPFAYIGLDFPFVATWLFASALLLLLYFVLFRKKREYPFWQFPQREKPKNTALPSLSGVSLLLISSLILCGGFYSFLNRNTAQIYTVATYNSYYAVIKQGNDAVAISLYGDTKSQKGLVDFLNSKGISRLISYIPLGTTQTGEVINTFYPEQSPLPKPPKSSPHAYSLSPTSTALFVDGESAVTTVLQGKSLLFTNSAKIAKSYSCDYLFFGGADEKLIEQNRAKCVILLKDALSEGKTLMLPF